MKFILGKKLGCLQLFNEKGEVTPVTLVGAEENIVIQIKTSEKDGYMAVQVGAGSKKENSISKSQRGHFKNLGSFAQVKEFRVSDVSAYKPGDKMDISVFAPGEKVSVSAQSAGRGFQGVVKRHGFRGGPASHGHRDVLRKPGSIGGRFPQRVLKGKRMAGRMGHDRVTVKNLEVVRVDVATNILAVKGAVPGRKGSWVEVRTT